MTEQFIESIKLGLVEPTMWNSRLAYNCKASSCENCILGNKLGTWCEEDHYLYRPIDPYLRDPNFIQLIQTQFPEYFI